MMKSGPLGWNYSVLPEKVYNECIGEYDTYAIKAVGSRSAIILHDVSSNKDEVCRMTELFNRHSLSPLHLRDAVEDMLP